MDMKQVLARAAMHAVLSTVASLVIVSAYLWTTFGEVGPTALMLAALCPLVLAFPVSALSLRQTQRLAGALASLRTAHEELADMHMRLAEAHARLSEKARHDDMTGMLNRRSFFAALKTARRRTDIGVLLIIDADHFKHINDTHGHLQGDHALVEIAGAIRGALRDGDLVGRIGGEEFAAFLVGADPDEAMLVAERIRLAVEAIRFHPEGGEHVPLSVSIGAARLRPDAAWSQMMREADRRLYEAKRRGRNRVVADWPEPVAA